MKSVVGVPALRQDAWGKALGQRKYPADVNLAGQIHAVMVRSPYARARIKSIDTSKALELKGVVEVLTAKDVPNNCHGVIFRDQPVLVGEHIRMYGDPVALVGAESLEIARKAADLVRVEYETQEPMVNPEEAMYPGSPLINQEVHGSGNVIYHLPIRRGDMSQGWAGADVIVQKEYKTQMVDHAFLQPEAVMAYVDEGGRLVVQVATQYPHYDRSEIAHVLGIRVNRVRVVCTAVGGAFGGREDISIQAAAALMAWRTKRPVKMENTRTESFQAHCKRHPMYLQYKTGAARDGKLVAMEARIVGDAGAYASWSPNILRKAAVHATGPYEIPNVKIDSYAVLTNNPYTGAMRGFGAAQVVVAYESQMDLLARSLGLDPVEMRLRNLLKSGSTTATGQVLTGSVGIAECLSKVAQRLREGSQ